MYIKTVYIVLGSVANLKLILYFDLKTDLFDEFVSHRLFLTFWWFIGSAWIFIIKITLILKLSILNQYWSWCQTSAILILVKFHTNTIYFKIFVNRYVIFGLLISSSIDWTKGVFWFNWNFFPAASWLTSS